MKMLNKDKLNHSLDAGTVYLREELNHLSTAIDRDLATLVEEGSLEKVGQGLYYKPKQSQYGQLPPNDSEVVKAFLRDEFFLIFSWNEYNKLGLGLTQLYNRVVVYNRKRHGMFKLRYQEYDFHCIVRGFPRQLTREFLLVDLINNLNELDEDPNKIKHNIKNSINLYNIDLLKKNIKLYGKVATRKFLEGVLSI